MLWVAPDTPPDGADEDQGERVPDSKPPFWMTGVFGLQPDVAEARAVDDVWDADGRRELEVDWGGAGTRATRRFQESALGSGREHERSNSLGE